MAETTSRYTVVYEGNPAGAKILSGEPAPGKAVAVMAGDLVADEAGRAKQDRVTLDYTNYRGERALRTVTPWGVEWGTTDWHPEPGWLLTCYDHDRAACRVYALSGIHSWNGAPVSAPLDLSTAVEG